MYIHLTLKGGNSSAYSFTYFVGEKLIGRCIFKEYNCPKITQRSCCPCHPVTASPPTQIHFRSMLVLGSSVSVFPHSTSVTWLLRTESRFSFLSPESVFPKVKETFSSYLTSQSCLLPAAMPTRGHPYSSFSVSRMSLSGQMFVVFMLNSPRVL